MRVNILNIVLLLPLSIPALWMLYFAGQVVVDLCKCRPVDNSNRSQLLAVLLVQLFLALLLFPHVTGAGKSDADWLSNFDTLDPILDPENDKLVQINPKSVLSQFNFDLFLRASAGLVCACCFDVLDRDEFDLSGDIIDWFDLYMVTFYVAVDGWYRQAMAWVLWFAFFSFVGRMSAHEEKERECRKWLNFGIIEIPFLILRVDGRFKYQLPVTIMMLKNVTELLNFRMTTGDLQELRNDESDPEDASDGSSTGESQTPQPAESSTEDTAAGVAAFCCPCLALLLLMYLTRVVVRLLTGQPLP